MLDKLAQKICAYLLKKQVIAEDLKDVYVYGFEILLSFVFSIIIIILIGLLTSNIIIAITYLSVFIITRRYVGGYHAHTHFGCQLCSFIVFSIVLILTCNINVNIVMIYTLATIGTTCIFILAPIENPYKPISKKQRKKCKAYGGVIFFITLIISLLVRDLNITLCNAVFYTQTAVIALMIKEIISKRRKQHENED